MSGSLDRPLALKPALTFVLWTGVAACDGAAQMARARLAAAAKRVIVFQPGTFMFMSSCGFQSLRSVATGLPGCRYLRLWDGEKSLPDPGDCRVLPAEFLSASGTGTMLGWAFRDAAAPASCTTGSAGAANHQDPVATSHLNGAPSRPAYGSGTSTSTGSATARCSSPARRLRAAARPRRRDRGGAEGRAVRQHRSIHQPACRAPPRASRGRESVMAPSPPDTQSP